jgi:AraC family L-rhamnose operon regulatory protein RhaS
MRRYKQFAPILISAFEVSEWHHPKHNHNHYELIYIKQGSGIHVINSQPVSYKSGSVFLLGPEETHFFEIGQITQFVYLKFTDLYLYKDEAVFNSGIRHLEYLLKSRETHLLDFILDVSDQLIVNGLFEVILSMKEDLLKNEQLIWMQALAVMHVLQRNMPEIKSIT